MILNSRRNLYGLILTTIVAAIGVLWGGGSILRVLLSLPLAFVLPGCALLFAWFPRRLQQVPQAALFSVSLSLAVIVIGGLLLHFTPWGLHTETWVVWLCSITLIHAGIARLRWQNSTELRPIARRVSLRPQQGLLFGLAASLFVVALYVARSGVLEQPRAGFTQLWIHEVAATDSVEVGVRNEEGQAMRYAFVIMYGEWTDSQTVALEPGEVWEKQFVLPADAAGKVQASLYDTEEAQTVYRQVSLWLPEAS